MNQPNRPLQRIAMWLAKQSSLDSRVDELRTHLDESAANNRPVTILDVGSIAILVSRGVLRDSARSVGKWAALRFRWSMTAIPATLLWVVFLGIGYESHFPAWDFASDGERALWTDSARLWNDLVIGMAVASSLFMAWAGGRAFESVSQGRVRLPLVLLAVSVGAMSQINRFVDRADWYRDSEDIYFALTANHANIIQPYSMALFGVFAAIPALYLVADSVLRRRASSRTA